jgi:rRNA maturation RNase YbeY
MVFGLGPAGTGKTYLAVAMAVSALLAKKVARIILVRPAVEAGERLGFLPGSLQEKVDPYLRPLYDALYDLLDPVKVDKMLETNVIEVAPLAFMRGRTLNDAFIIMDEAQNTTNEQMKMFLTRLGNASKAVITGDLTQIDLPNPKKSGLFEALRVLDGVEGICWCSGLCGRMTRISGPSSCRWRWMAFRWRSRWRRRPSGCCTRSKGLRERWRPPCDIARRLFVFMASKPGCGSIRASMMTLEPPRKLAGSAGKIEHVTDAETWRAWGLSRTGLSRFLRTAQTEVGLRGEVEVLLAGDRTLRRLNRTFRGKDKATDVLSFPAPEEFAGDHAGDLAISLDTAKKQADEHGHALRDEVRVLLLHGVLHLAGFDHEVDSGEMAAREAELRRKLGLGTGLIARASGPVRKAGKRQKRNTEILSVAQNDGPKRNDGRKRNGSRKKVAARRKVRR